MLTILTALAALAAPGPQTTAADRALSIAVRHSDLKLARAKDREILDRRIARAVEKLCPTIQTGQSTPALAGLRCRRETLARLTPQRNRAVAQATAPALLSASTR
jgi:UrcA family protein